MNLLSPKRRSELRAEAHKLSPVVIIGDKGLTDEVLTEIDRSLKAHELIKVRAATDERDARAVWIETICDKLQAHPVQQIGKVFVIYRQTPKEEKKAEPASSPRARAGRDEEKRGGPGVEKPPRVQSRGRGNDARSTYVKKKGAPTLKRRPRGATVEAEASNDVKRISRPRSRTPSPRPASGPRRRPRNTSR
jgi:putative YhbY family RNA-binding protein